MMNVSYKLLQLNRKVLITIENRCKIMLYRDFKKALEVSNAILSEKENIIYGSNYMLDCKISEVN